VCAHPFWDGGPALSPCDMPPEPRFHAYLDSRRSRPSTALSRGGGGGGGGSRGVLSAGDAVVLGSPAGVDREVRSPLSSPSGTPARPLSRAAAGAALDSDGGSDGGAVESNARDDPSIAGPAAVGFSVDTGLQRLVLPDIPINEVRCDVISALIHCRVHHRVVCVYGALARWCSAPTTSA
jgi:hypothetical protein